MKDSAAWKTVAVVTMLAAWVGLYRLHHPRPPRIDRRPHEVVGEVLAGEAVRLLAPGARLIVIARDSVPFRVPACEAQLDGFLRGVRKARKPVTEIRRIRLDPLRPVAVPPGDFFDLLRFGRPEDIIVSFLGPPVLGPDQVAALGDRWPMVLAVCSGASASAVELKQLFARGLVVAVVIGRPGAPAVAGAGSRQQAFAQMFKLVTPVNLEELPGPGATN